MDSCVQGRGDARGPSSSRLGPGLDGETGVTQVGSDLGSSTVSPCE